jgi:hypothetical protein
MKWWFIWITWISAEIGNVLSRNRLGRVDSKRNIKGHWWRWKYHRCLPYICGVIIDSAIDWSKTIVRKGNCTKYEPADYHSYLSGPKTHVCSCKQIVTMYLHMMWFERQIGLLSTLRMYKGYIYTLMKSSNRFNNNKCATMIDVVWCNQIGCWLILHIFGSKKDVPRYNCKPQPVNRSIPKYWSIMPVFRDVGTWRRNLKNRTSRVDLGTFFCMYML